MTHNFERLKAHILPMSLATRFEAARLEWIPNSVEESDKFDSCPYGQNIKEHCYICNKFTGSPIYAVNVCVNQLIGLAAIIGATPNSSLSKARS